MADPLDALRAPVEPVDPGPAFAAALRARVARALLDPPASRTVAARAPQPPQPPHDPDRTGDAVTTSAAPPTAPTLTPYLGVSDGPRALDWYAEVFAARPHGEPVRMADGSIGHAELVIGDAFLYLAEGVHGPRGATSSIVVQVPDVDATVQRAVAAGAELERPPADNPYGRNAVVVDPFGHRWLVSAAPDAPATEASAAQTSPAEAPAARPARHGDVAYLTLAVRDAERAKAFYGAVLGWRYAPGTVEEGWQVQGPEPAVGLWGGRERPEVQLCYRVDDVAAAVRAVRDHGGQAADPDPKPYGLLADCVDDQGVTFQLWQPTN